MKDYRPPDICRGSGGFDTFRSQQAQKNDLKAIDEKIRKYGPWASAKLPSFLRRKKSPKPETQDDQ